jgi:hypothetical protein
MAFAKGLGACLGLFGTLFGPPRVLWLCVQPTKATRAAGGQG